VPAAALVRPEGGGLARVVEQGGQAEVSVVRQPRCLVEDGEQVRADVERVVARALVEAEGRLDLRQELGELAALACPLNRLGRPRPRKQGDEDAPTLH
jgi:hypothetical protein